VIHITFPNIFVDICPRFCREIPGVGCLSSRARCRKARPSLAPLLGQSFSPPNSPGPVFDQPSSSSPAELSVCKLCPRLNCICSATGFCTHCAFHNTSTLTATPPPFHTSQESDERGLGGGGGKQRTPPPLVANAVLTGRGLRQRGLYLFEDGNLFLQSAPQRWSS